MQKITLIGTTPKSLCDEADSAVKSLRWTAPYFVDADHINLHTVDAFMPHSDFFTIDVADYSGQPPSAEDKQRFIKKTLDWSEPIKCRILQIPLR